MISPKKTAAVDDGKKTDFEVEKRSSEIVQGTSVVFLGALVGRVLRFCTIVLLGRVLGPHSFGVYALSFSIIEILRRFCLLGIDTGLLKFIPILSLRAEESEIRGTIIASYTIVGCIGLVLGGILFIGSPFLAEGIFGIPAASSALKVFAIALPFYAVVTLTAFTARSFKRMGEDVAIREISHPFLTLFCCTVLFLLGYRLMGAALGFLLSTVLSALLGLILVAKIFPPLFSAMKASFHVTRLLRFSLPVVVIGFSQLLLYQTDKIMIGYFMAEKDVGIYSAASTLALQMAIILNAFVAIFSPIMAELQHEKKVCQLEELLGRVTRWVLLITIPMFLVFLLFPSQVMGIYGPTYTSGWSTLVIISLACLIGVAFGPLGYLLVMSGRQDVELVNNVAMVVANVALNIWLIPQYGIVGAAMATGSTLLLISLIRLGEVYWLMDMYPFSRKYVKPAGAALIACLLGFLIKNASNAQYWWLVGSAVLVFTYVGLLLTFRLEREDKDAMLILLRIRQ